MKNKQKRNYDWEAIKRDYRTKRFESDRALCRHWDVPEATLRLRKKGNPTTGEKPWARDLVRDFHEKLKNQSIQELAHDPAQPTQSAQSAQDCADDEKTVEDAANAAMSVLRKHNKKISTLNEISDKLSDVLLSALVDDKPELLDKWSTKSESASDMFNKLTKATADVIKLERQNLNLDDEKVQDESKGITIDKIEIIGVDPEDELGNS